MTIAAYVLLLLAAAIHLCIFVLQSLLWTTPTARRVFGNTEAEAATTAELAFNQGFYNLVLGLMVVVGFLLALIGHPIVGHTVIACGASAMAAAGVFLFSTSTTKRGPALIQALPPLLGLALLVLGIGS